MLTINKLVLTIIYKTLYSMTAEFYVQAKMKHQKTQLSRKSVRKRELENPTLGN